MTARDRNMIRWMMVMLMTGLVASGLTGCGSSAPPRPQEEVESTASQHEAMAQKMEDMYKKGGPKKAHGN